MSRFRVAAGLVTCAAVLSACKGETKFKDNPDTLAKLDSCSKGAAAKDQLIKGYEARIAELERAGQTGGEIVVRFEGDILTVTSGKQGTGKPALDDKVSVALSREFTDVVT